MSYIEIASNRAKYRSHLSLKKKKKIDFKIIFVTEVIVLQTKTSIDLFMMNNNRESYFKRKPIISFHMFSNFNAIRSVSIPIPHHLPNSISQPPLYILNNSSYLNLTDI